MLSFFAEGESRNFLAVQWNSFARNYCTRGEGTRSILNLQTGSAVEAWSYSILVEDRTWLCAKSRFRVSLESQSRFRSSFATCECTLGRELVGMRRDYSLLVLCLHVPSAYLVFTGRNIFFPTKYSLIVPGYFADIFLTAAGRYDFVFACVWQVRES